MSTPKTAIVPLNIKALRVSYEDSRSTNTPTFAGSTVDFEQLPYYGKNDPLKAYTGHEVQLSLEGGPKSKLGFGIHLHWELPDHFRRAGQEQDGGELVFPHVPNRWLVIRHFSLLNNGTPGPVQTEKWVVESDFLSDSPLDNRAVSVPIPYNPEMNRSTTPPYKYLGRVLLYSEWVNHNNSGDEYLKDYKDEKNEDFYLTAVGFAGPTFSAFYPECASVFGFHDDFADLTNVQGTDVHDKIDNNLPINFQVSYQVIGWDSEPVHDSLNSFDNEIAQGYDQLLTDYDLEGLDIDTNEQVPIFNSLFTDTAGKKFEWIFNQGNINPSFNPDGTSNDSDIPTQTLCNGIIQEIVWDMDTNDEFLTQTLSGDVDVAVGNSTIEALSALMKMEMEEEGASEELLQDWEYLLDAIQLGLLQRVDQNDLFALDEALHAHGFSRHSGGNIFVITESSETAANDAQSFTRKPELPLDLAGALNALNRALKNYEQGREKVENIRKQVYMDWFRFIYYFSEGDVPSSSPQDYMSHIKNFLQSGSAGEVSYATNMDLETGLLGYGNEDGVITLVAVPKNASSSPDVFSLAYQVVVEFNTINGMLGNGNKYPEMALKLEPAKGFYTPMDPVVMVQGDKVEPVRRNGDDLNVACRLEPEIVTQIEVTDGNSAPVIVRSSPPVFSGTNMDSTIILLMQEACLLNPMLAPTVANNLSTSLQTSLQAAQSQLYANIQPDQPPIQSDPAITIGNTQFVFKGRVPDSIGWEQQKRYTELENDSRQRLDPFLPVFLIWEVTFFPIQTDGNGSYLQNVISEIADNGGDFLLDDEHIDYENSSSFQDDNIACATNSNGTCKVYKGSVLLSQSASYSLVDQINSYEETYPLDDNTKAELADVIEQYMKLKIVSQALSGFNAALITQKIVPKLPVTNQVGDDEDDRWTKKLRDAIGDTAEREDWNEGDFNTEIPIYTGAADFGPLRGGNIKINSLQLVDVFGQRMDLNFRSEDVIPAFTVQDYKTPGKIFLPPRLEIPTRLWCRWCAASSYDQNGDSTNTDMIEMNPIPDTSPICGWVMPNHLDFSLFFYDADGSPVGSFGIEGGELKYRTRPENTAINITDDLDMDITNLHVNPHMAQFMHFVRQDNSTLAARQQAANLFIDFLYALDTSAELIRPGNAGQNTDLALLIGQPFALTRAIVKMESSGNRVPINQLDQRFEDEVELWTNDKDSYSFEERQNRNSANMESVDFPIIMGDYAKPNDGLVGYFIEDNADPSGYQSSKFYSSAIPEVTSGFNNGVEKPGTNNILLNLNGAPVSLTLLVDPRVSIHVTSGILPIEKMTIPPELYKETIRNLAMTFFTTPVMKEAEGLTVPLPQETGFDWSWIQADGSSLIPLDSNASTQDAHADYSPQEIWEGWLKLKRKTRPNDE